MLINELCLVAYVSCSFIAVQLLHSQGTCATIKVVSRNIYIHKSVIVSKRFQHSILDEKLGEILHIHSHVVCMLCEHPCTIFHMFYSVHFSKWRPV